MRANQPAPRPRQIEVGTFIGCQGGATTPVFWIWRPAGLTTEYWVLYLANQPGGFQRPGTSHPSVEWKIDLAKGGSYTTGCEFLSWVASEYELAEADLEVHEHAVEQLDC